MELKACLNPNCEEPDVRIEKGNSMVKVWCAYCVASTGWMDTEAEAISAWNTRPDLKPLYDLADEWTKCEMPEVCDCTTTTPEQLIGSVGSIRHCGKRLRKALKQMEA